MLLELRHMSVMSAAYLSVRLIKAQLTGDIDVLNQMALVKEQCCQDYDIAGLHLSFVLLTLIRLLWCHSLQFRPIPKAHRANFAVSKAPFRSIFALLD